ncbi:hypothetical protein [Kushneria sinocarnis]|uniref:hypothetical protein n=1 Tax=Kushneria sinocarnis TaxID=595502 RepID=UPI0011C3A7B1|nr:hypothetical protein [Kushneria sinocarnis]
MKLKPAWSEEQEQFLRDHYGSLSPHEICQSMPEPKKSYSAVITRAGKLGLSDPNANKRSYADRDQFYMAAVCRLTTSLFRDYATAPQRYVMAKREPESVGGAA